jgi:zinc transporter ZupT
MEKGRKRSPSSKTSSPRSVAEGKKEEKKGRVHGADFDGEGYALLLLMIGITVFAYPEQNLDRPTLAYVFYYGWITAVSTGAGVLPFYLVGIPNKMWMGVSNAVACGMMIAASYSLSFEGMTLDEETEGWGVRDGRAGASSWVAKSVSGVMDNLGLGHFADPDALDSPTSRTLLGMTLGIVFIVVTQRVLDKYEDLKVGGFEGANAQKMVLIIFVMTLHSLSEGIGIGVSFGGNSGMHLGQFISFSLALHNIPEGLAVALVLTSRGVSRLRSGLWAVFTSLPQPVMALPAFLFVQQFLPLLPVGLGFAAGAMAWVAVFELFMDAWNDAGLAVTIPVGVVAFGVMTYVQNLLHESL